jgi:hypothetical protein
LVSLFFTFFTCIFELFSLDVLRVLTKQNLEIRKEVKDSYVPNASLAKVVKDSTLLILSILDQFVVVICGSKGAVFGVSVELGRTS